MNIFRIVQDDKGRLMRVELNGMRLPLLEPPSLDITRDFEWSGRAWTVQLTIVLDDVDFVTGEVETTVVDADPAHRLIEAPPQS